MCDGRPSVRLWLPNDLDLRRVVPPRGSVGVLNFVAQTVAVAVPDDGTANAPLAILPPLVAPLRSQCHIGLGRPDSRAMIDRRVGCRLNSSHEDLAEDLHVSGEDLSWIGLEERGPDLRELCRQFAFVDQLVLHLVDRVAISARCPTVAVFALSYDHEPRLLDPREVIERRAIRVVVRVPSGGFRDVERPVRTIQDERIERPTHFALETGQTHVSPPCVL